MSKTLVNTDKAPAAIGPYSQGIKIGNLLYTSGQIPLEPGAKQLVSSEIKEQARQVFKNLKAVIEAGGAQVGSVVKTTVFVTDLGDFATINAEYAAFFDEFAKGKSYPARSTVQVAALPMGAKVEIEAIAAL